jgi:UDP-galactopyranose mutase
MKNHYNILLIGAGLFNAVLAHHFIKQGKSVLVIEKRSHIAGNCYTERRENIDLHVFGAHIVHTSNKKVWDFLNQFGEFNNFINSPIANYKGKIYNLPFNMNTFSQLFGVVTPTEAEAAILNEKMKELMCVPSNLEEQAIAMVGRTIYEKLIKGYTQKQWGRKCTELPPEIIKRLPLRFTYDNNYFNDKYQGIPVEGYTKIIERMFEGADILLNTDFLKDKEKWESMADHVFYSGCIDEYYDYCYGPLEYRSVRFETEVLDKENYQGNAVVNYTSDEEPYTRIIEHKWFNNMGSDKTIISKEYSSEWKKGDVPYYPVNNEKNNALYEKYKAIPNEKVTWCGRLGNFKYYDMDDTIEAAFKLIETL